MKIDEKYELVLKAYQNAYAKYSKFKVGALVILKNGDFLLGSNIENASYGLSNCAERSALFATYSNGFQKDDIEELVLIGRSNNFLYPCGACRQVICELMNLDAKITLFSFMNTRSINKNNLLLIGCINALNFIASSLSLR